MNINELGEDLEQQFGKPRNITEENVRFMISLIKEEFDGTKVNENIETPSLEAFGMTILAVMSYQTTPWEELAKKPSIRKTLKYIAIRGNDHYDEMEALTKELIRKHFNGITQKMVLGFLKIIRGVSNEERPTKLIEYTPFAAQYYAIQYGLHQLIRGEHPDDAAVIIHCAIEDGILFPTIPRSLLVDEFNLKKSSFDKYFSKYHINLKYESDAVKKQVEEKRSSRVNPHEIRLFSGCPYYFTLPMYCDNHFFTEQFWYPSKKCRSLCMNMYNIIFSKSTT